MIVKPLILLFLVTGAVLCADAVAVSVVRTPAIESLQLHRDVRTWDETIVITPPFTEFVVPIELPVTPDPEAFRTVLFPQDCCAVTF